MPESYLQRKKKQEVREFLISKFQFKTIVGLAGPDINEYIEYLSSKGAEKFEIYEKDPNVLIKQLSCLDTTVNVSLNYDDIIKADSNKKDTLFDLDFCVTAKNMKEYIKKFKSNFIMTFSLRPMGEQSTITKFLKERKEYILSRQWNKVPRKHMIFKTNKSEYIYIPYRDTTTMCCIAKIN